MSDYGWGPSGPKVRNHTLTAMKPNTIYEFGLNLIYLNDTFGQFPSAGTGQICACKTHGRRTDCKSGKHPFLISFNPSRRIHSGSGNDSFGLGGGSDLTTSGVPLDLSTLEPLWNQEVNSLYGIGKSDLISFEQVTQISAANIRFQRYIGCGAFGKVWEGWLHVTGVDGDRFEKVALKVRNSKSLTEAEFRREATLMHRYQHANIVRFFGVSFDSPGQQCLVLEMMDQGNLRDYLHRARPRIAPNVAANMFAAAAICAAGGSSGAGDGRNGSEGSSMNTSTTSTAAGCGTTTASNVITLTAQLDLPALIGIMRDIAQGCRYLEEQHFVHSLQVDKQQYLNRLMKIIKKHRNGLRIGLSMIAAHKSMERVIIMPKTHGGSPVPMLFSGYHLETHNISLEQCEFRYTSPPSEPEKGFGLLLDAQRCYYQRYTTWLMNDRRTLSGSTRLSFSPSVTPQVTF
ncbi:unnamed protein product [Echinostoma caproni]|uniref:receptor protein-tyrosine kinase n=1 Tax=Echinostoma caproni TaxID=27848 RepID=A0A183A538_9TREM|nr:unnamed protein product [Echinostoma caproni]